LLREKRVKGITVSQAVGFDYPLSFAFRKSLPQLGRQLEAGLQRLDVSTRQGIINRWIDASALEYEDQRRRVLRWAGLLLSALAAIVLTVSYLRRREKGSA
jgi:hypothetical protein